MDLAYRSPFEGDTELALDVLPSGVCVWTYQKIAVAMVPPLPNWTMGLRNWYAARRDANLLGECLLCAAVMDPVPAGMLHGEMRHEDDCAVIDPLWWAEYRRQMAGIAWVQA